MYCLTRPVLFVEVFYFELTEYYLISPAIQTRFTFRRNSACIASRKTFAPATSVFQSALSNLQLEMEYLREENRLIRESSPQVYNNTQHSLRLSQVRNLYFSQLKFVMTYGKDIGCCFAFGESFLETN